MKPCKCNKLFLGLTSQQYQSSYSNPNLFISCLKCLLSTINCFQQFLLSPWRSLLQFTTALLQVVKQTHITHQSLWPSYIHNPNSADLLTFAHFFLWAVVNIRLLPSLLYQMSSMNPRKTSSYLFSLLTLLIYLIKRSVGAVAPTTCPTSHHNSFHPNQPLFVLLDLTKQKKGVWQSNSLYINNGLRLAELSYFVQAMPCQKFYSTILNFNNYVRNLTIYIQHAFWTSLINLQALNQQPL